MRYRPENVRGREGPDLKFLTARICGSGKWVLYNIGQLVNQWAFHWKPLSGWLPLIGPVPGNSGENRLHPLRKTGGPMFVDEQFVCHRTYVGGKIVFDRLTDTGERIFNPEAMKRRVENA